MKPFSPAEASQAAQISPLAVPARTSLQLVDHTGQRVSCLMGQVWVTQQDDRRDVILQAGECFVLDRPGLALVFAFQDALLTVGAPALHEASP